MANALAIVEIIDRRGRVQHRERVFALPAIIGRGFDSDVILVDRFVAARHCRIDADEGGGFRITDLDTRNGFSLPNRADAETTGTTAIVAPGEIVRLGHSQIRIWRPDSPVLHEVPTSKNDEYWQRVALALWFAAVLGLTGLQEWFGVTGISVGGNALLTAMLFAGSALVWSGVWWLGSRSMHSVMAYVRHATVALSSVVLFMLGLMCANTIVFAFGVFELDADQILLLAVAVALVADVFRHLRLVSRMAGSRLAVYSLVLTAALILPVGYWQTLGNQERPGELKVSGPVGPPWSRLVDGIAPDAFVDSALRQ